ncbi:transcriptional regulator [Salsuginibacillus halophilus]|uniref:Transcriptional regulator n=1 Tax=Salsuginibacillus halophilus TaxID=517424 RepID=A0A2P8HYP3_9BACI|nr:MerR family transcriptional regulator [Salsuginibacillus halophilus]PSL51284.1 transcriptional regulator [Salsuginibacillus halophilus]
MTDEERRSLPLFPIRVVKQLTQLTPRQIRYYEEHRLIYPERTEGNQRLFSFNDVDRLLEVKRLIDQGVNLAGIKEIMQLELESQAQLDLQDEEEKETKRELSDRELRRHMKREAMMAASQKKTSMIQGQLSHFFH